MNMIAEGIQEYLKANPPRRKVTQENTIKASELKFLVKEVVKQVVKEAGPQYKVRDGETQVERPGEIMRAREIQDDPTINEDNWIQGAVDPSHKGYCTPMSKPTCTGHRRALAKRFKSGDLSEKAPPGFSPHGKHADIRHKVMKQYGADSPKTYGTLNKIAKNIGEEADAQYKVVQKNLTDVNKVDKAKKNQKDPKVTENHKVQARSYTTINDVPQDPENVRDPKVPGP